MGALKWFVSALFLIVPSAADPRGRGGGETVPAADRSSARQIDRWSPYIEEASARFGIPKDWIRRVMRAESGGRTTMDGRPITSRAEAMGLMQLMPRTWAAMRARHSLGSDPHLPRDNILAGAAYLRAMYDRFGYPGLFAAYNAGPTRYAEHLASGRRLPAETVAYAAAVGTEPSRTAASVRNVSRQSGIFASLLKYNRRDIEPARSPAASDALFVRLSTAAPAIE